MRTLVVVLVAGCALGCGGSPGVNPALGDSSPADGVAVQDASAVAADGAPPGVDAGPPPQLVDVGHERELRAVWVATVANIDFPSQPGLSVAAQKAELVQILETAAAAHLNAVVFQVRPEADALYASQLEPWSRYLTGAQGQDPGYDPLAYLIEQARPRGIEVHAWLNPYRAKASKGSAAVAPHLSVIMPEHAHAYGDGVWMDPGAQVVADHTVGVVQDLLARYDIDGVHMDDYFYPYPDGTDFPDAASYAAYQATGGALDRDDWRRDNVNRLVEALSSAVLATKPHVRFGVSPFGIYRPGTPVGITGLDQFAAIYADPPLWKARGWVDYLAPQLYWPSTQTKQAFAPLIDWWSALPPVERYTFAGLFLSKLGTDSAWDLDEFRIQVGLCRAHRQRNALGNFYFSVKPLLEDREGIVSVMSDELYRDRALPPPSVATGADVVAPPQIAVDGTRVTIVAHPAIADVRYWLVYADGPSGWQLQRILPAKVTSAALEPGRWAISAVAKHLGESRGVLIERSAP